MIELVKPTDDRDSPASFLTIGPMLGENVKWSAGFTVVVSCGPAEDWAAYFGPPTWSPERIAQRGVKLPRDAAMAMFPNVKGYYRD